MIGKHVVLGALAAVLLAACSSPTAPAARHRAPGAALGDEAPTPPPQTNANSGNLFGSGT